MAITANITDDLENGIECKKIVIKGQEPLSC
jgi:hypothetical protein